MGERRMSARADFLRRFFQLLDARGVGFCLAQDPRKDPAAEGKTDVDVFIAPHQLRTAGCLLDEAARATGLAVFRRIRREYEYQVFLARPDALEVFHLDLRPVADYKGAAYLDVTKVVQNRVRKGSLYYPLEADLAVYLLLRHLLWGGKVKHMERIQELFSSHTAQVQRVLAEAVGHRMAEHVVGSAVSGRKDRLEQSGRALRRAVVKRACIRSPVETAYFSGLYVFFETMQLVRPTGILVLAEPEVPSEAATAMTYMLADGFVFFREWCSVLEEDKGGHSLAQRLRGLPKLFKCLKYYGVVVIRPGHPLAWLHDAKLQSPDGTRTFVRFRDGVSVEIRRDCQLELRCAAVEYLSRREESRKKSWLSVLYP